MSEEISEMVTDQAETVGSIPVPSEPQVLKSSDEILSELFGAFNATPPPLDDLQTLDTNSTLSDKSHKKHKKHNKKKHKKDKRKKKRSSSSDSTGSKESKKKHSKKHKKGGSKHVNSESSVVSSKKKKRKLGKFSASDTDSDDEEPSSKKHKDKDKSTDDQKMLSSVKVKEENVDVKTSKVNGSTVSTVPEVIRENILKQAVSKIVDKVIRSTDLASEIRRSINGSKYTPSSSDNDTVDDETYINKKQIKQEPKECKTPNPIVKSSEISDVGDTIEEIKKPSQKDAATVEVQETKCVLEPPKSLHVADVFAEDLIDCGIKKDDLKPNADKPKPTGGKIKMPNLKFSQVYEATVKQIEEEAKLKAEKYEEGEISESSEEERSPTPSDLSSSGSIEDTKNTEDKKKRCHHRRRHRHHHHTSHRSRSREKHSSHSNSVHHHRVDKKEKHRDREKRRSRERDTSRGRDKDKDRSGDGKSSRDRTRDRSRSRDRTKDKAQSRSRSRERRRSRSRSKDRSKLEAKKRSTSRDKKGKDRDRSKERNRSRDRDVRRHVKTRARSREREKRSPDEKIDKQKLLEIARKNALNMLKNPAGTVDQTKLAITSGGKTVNELTDFCKLLSKKDADGHESISSNTSGDESESEKPFHHPFLIKDRPSSIVLNIRNSVALPVKSLQEKAAEQSRQLRLQFPVSSGQQHRKTEAEWVPVSPKRLEAPATQVALVKPNTKRVFKDLPPTPELDIGSIVSQRLDAIRRLQENPTDSGALSQMQSAQENMKTWAESKQLAPGQFSGSTGVKVLSQAELASGYQAWARRDQLQVAAPVNHGVGMTLLQKMGWRPGEGLGKNKEGTLQPLLLEVKMDKKGLVAQEELPVRQSHQNLRGKPRSLEGKHPVSLLNEYCSRRKLGAPFFEMVDEAGPDHKKNFLFKVRVNGVEYKPAVGSPKKKQARAEAAEVCLKALGILPNK